MSEGELLENAATQDAMGANPSTVISASHLAEVVNSPQRNYYLWKDSGKISFSFFVERFFMDRLFFSLLNCVE